MTTPTEFTVLVCGGGNASQVVTGLIGGRYKTIAVSFFADEAARWKAALGKDQFELTVSGAQPGNDKMYSKPYDITNDPSVAAKADVIILAVPSFAHGEYFEKFAPYMKPGTIVGVMPARSGGDILFSSKLGEKAKDMIFVGFETLPWACRFSEWGRKATILGTKNNILAAVTPVSKKGQALSVLQGLLGVHPLVIESPNNLGVSLRNPGMIVHPGVMYGRWCPDAWDGKPKKEKPLFYQGVDEFTEKVLLAMTDEVQAVRFRMEKEVAGLDLKDACTLKQWYMDCYDGQMKDTSTLKGCMNTNSAYEGLTHPCKDQADGTYMPDLNYRYLAEDVPTGLCFAKGLAEILKIPTPTIDKVLMWAQECIGLEIMKDGKMCGADVAKTRAPQGVGINDLAGFLKMSKIEPAKNASGTTQAIKPGVPAGPSLMSLCKLPPAGYMGMAERGAQVCQMGALKVFIQSAFAGCYIGFGVQLSMTIVGGIAHMTKDDPGVSKFVFAALFPVLLFLILMSGALLYTGVTAIVPMAVLEGKVHWINIPKYFAISWLGNLVGCLVFVACIQYCDMNLDDSGNGRLAAKIAKAKVKKDFLIVFIKGIGCNWLVCMAIFMFGQAQDTAGKMVAIWFPISCFVAIGFEHVPANMYIITLGLLADADVTVAEMIWKNFIPATLGNTFAGTIIVACGYSFLYGALGKRFDNLLAPASTEPKAPTTNTP